MITKFGVQNFKSIGEPGVDLELSPITVLVGPNNAGKSSILEAFAFCPQSRGTQIFNGGELVSIRRPYLFHKKDNKKIVRIKIGTIFENKNTCYTYEIKPDKSEVLERIEIDKVKYELKHWAALDNNRLSEFQEPEVLRGQKSNENNFSFLFRHSWYGSNLSVSNELKIAREVITDIYNKLDHVYFISVGRGNVELRDRTRGPPKWVGKQGEDLLPILHSIFTNRRNFPIRDKIVKWAEKFGMADLFSSWIGESVIESTFTDEVLNTEVHLGMGGFGSKQIISIITQFFYSPKGSIILIEEPEVSLHPKQQIVLLELFAEAKKEGKQVIFTTHSEFLLLSTGVHVQKGLIAPEDVSINHIIKEEENKGTTSTRLRINSKGYIENWVPSFTEIENKLFKGWFKGLPEDE